jgi:RNA polymerase sigma factor (sigma-70 family)
MTATRTLSASLQHLTRAFTDDTAPDAELVGRFVARRDHAAFTALVRRYGGVVFGVCRRVLRHEQDAEDAFQATFLVFARDAARVQRAGAVGNWLYGVAHNVARKARSNRLRRTAKEYEAATQPRPEPRTPDDELNELLDAELAALPDKYRAAVVLCDLRGLTMQQAADEVGCPAKTLGSRLQRGRAQLARRLARKGVLPALVALPAMAGAAPPALIDATARAVGPEATVTPAVAALVTGGSAMLKTSVKFVLVAGVLGLAAGPVWQALHAAPRSAARPASAKPTPPNGFLAALHAFHDYMYGHFRDVVHAFDDKKDEKKVELSGTWVKSEGEMKVTFEKETVKLSPHGKDDVILILCDYTADKKGVVKCKVTGFEGKPEARKAIGEKLPVGTEFTFTWKVTKETAKLDEVKGDKIEPFKSHMEGEYGSK